MREHDHILATMERDHQVGIGESAFDLSPPAFLYRRFRSGNETWEILPRLIAEWTIATISEREPNVACARLCLNIPRDIDQETRKRMQMAFRLWLAGRMRMKPGMGLDVKVIDY